MLVSRRVQVPSKFASNLRVFAKVWREVQPCMAKSCAIVCLASECPRIAVEDSFKAWCFLSWLLPVSQPLMASYPLRLLCSSSRLCEVIRALCSHLDGELCNMAHLECFTEFRLLQPKVSICSTILQSIQHPLPWICSCYFQIKLFMMCQNHFKILFKDSKIAFQQVVFQ